jgi:hypothetical protein
VAIAYGVNVHAAVRVHGNDREQLQRLCRYLGRPPIAEERLTRTEDGRNHHEGAGWRPSWQRGSPGGSEQTGFRTNPYGTAGM